MHHVTMICELVASSRSFVKMMLRFCLMICRLTFRKILNIFEKAYRLRSVTYVHVSLFRTGNVAVPYVARIPISDANPNPVPQRQS